MNEGDCSTGEPPTRAKPRPMDLRILYAPAADSKRNLDLFSFLTVRNRDLLTGRWLAPRRLLSRSGMVPTVPDRMMRRFPTPTPSRLLTQLERDRESLNNSGIHPRHSDTENETSKTISIYSEPRLSLYSDPWQPVRPSRTRSPLLDPPYLLPAVLNKTNPPRATEYPKTCVAVIVEPKMRTEPEMRS